MFIGIDGGGTKTKCVLTDEQLKVVSLSESGASNPMVVGVEKSARILFDLIYKISSNVNIKEIDAAVIGVAGGGRKKIANELKQSIQNLATCHNFLLKNLEVVSDAEIAVEGAFSGDAGAILIAGTGSIVFGKNKKGKLFRAGGYGRILGDEGSGFSIGKSGLQAVAKEFDESEKKSFLSRILSKKFSIKNRDDLILKVYTENFDIASLASFVIKGAEDGDKVCRKILEKEINELLKVILSFEKIFPERNFNLCFGGGLLQSDNYYSKKLKREIKKKFKEIKFTEIIHPHEVGAAILAKKIYLKLI
jgi:N-acetylglucosamine kinase-like BadF-type ATPase